MKDNYLVSNFGEYMDVVMNGTIVESSDTMVQGKMVRTFIWLYDGKIYAVNKIHEDVVYCIRLA